MITSDDRVIGVMIVSRKQKQQFSKPIKQLLSLLATQTAIAMNRAERFEEIEKRNRQLRNLGDACTAVTKATLAGLQATLDRIAEAAVDCVSDREGGGVLATVQRHDAGRRKLSFAALCCPQDDHENLRIQHGAERDVRETVPGNYRCGITVRSVLIRRLQNVPDVRKDTDYEVFHTKTRSELDVPLIDGDAVLGVLNVESSRTSAFDENDERTLTSLGELAVATIKNIRQYGDLSTAEQLVESGRALAARMVDLAYTRHHGPRRANFIAHRITKVQEMLENKRDRRYVEVELVLSCRNSRRITCVVEISFSVEFSGLS